jgi:alcohol dehydrogenase (cytochrome c)
LSETWVGSALEHGCGATWMSGSYDPQLDLVYWAVGNPCPDFNGVDRAGDNLYTDSVLALKPESGELQWYFQFTPHDTHDWDADEPMMLVDTSYEGRPRKLLVQADRNGFFFLLDRTNGQFLRATPFVSKIRWASGYTSEGKAIVLPDSEPTLEGNLTCPSSATNWMSAAYNESTKLFYLAATDRCSITKLVPARIRFARWMCAPARRSGITCRLAMAAAAAARSRPTGVWSFLAPTTVCSRRSMRAAASRSGIFRPTRNSGPRR